MLRSPDQYASALYGPVSIFARGTGLSATIGDRKYAINLSHWSGDTFLLTSDNPDIEPGLISFAFGDKSASATGFSGSPVPGALSISYGEFQRVP